MNARKNWLGYTLFLFLLLAIAFPIYWMVSTSFKPEAEIGQWPLHLLPDTPTWQHYAEAFQKYHFGVYLMNSVIVSVVSTIFVVLLGSLAAYSIARLPIRGAVPLMIATLMISLFPPISVITPLYVLLKEMGWLNSFQALILPYTAFHLPFAIWIMRNYFLDIPKELEEAARVDGASTLQTFLKVVLPISIPGLFAASLFTFFASWTEFLMSITFNSTTTTRTIPVAIALFGGDYTIPYGTMFAASTVAILPLLLIVFVFQKRVISGITGGAIKG